MTLRHSTITAPQLHPDDITVENSRHTNYDALAREQKSANLPAH